jgi:hypothetical protein
MRLVEEEEGNTDVDILLSCVEREESACEQPRVRQLRQLRERCEVATVLRRRGFVPAPPSAQKTTI